MSTHRFVWKSAGTIGLFTSASRVLGFVRDLTIASLFGTGVSAEAFVVSFRIPNLLRDLVGEGAANAAFVPVLTECREKEPAAFWRLVSTLLYLMAAVLAVLTVLGVIFAPQIVSWIAPGFSDSADPSKFPLAVRLTRAIFPYLFLIGLSALAMGVLNSLREFTSSAAGPVLLNCSMIAAAFFLEPRYGPMALVVGVLAGGALQLACQVPPLVRRGIRLSAPAFRHPAVRQAGKLLVPRALGSAIYQINVFVDSILASFESIVGPGGQSALYYSNRLFQLPLAIFGLSLAQALLPTFSTQIVRGDREAFRNTFASSVRMLGFLIFPASVGFVAMTEPIVRIIFERGRFDAYSTTITSGALFYYAFGLFSCCLVKILANAFYAMQDTRTPVKTMAVAVAVNVLLCLLLMRPLGIGGLTLASSLSATLNAVMLYGALRRRFGALGGRRIWEGLWKMALAASGMGIWAAFFAARFLDGAPERPLLTDAGRLAAGIVTSVLLYLGLSLLLGVEEPRKMLRARRS